VDPKENDVELLSGADPSQARAEDAKHWVQVYGELRTVVDNLLADQEITSASVDTTALAEQRDYYARRLAWWGARLNR
jgi:hypothetical protein